MGRYPNARNWQGIPVLLAAALSIGLASAPVRGEQDAIPLWQAVDAATGRLTGITDLQALLVMFPDSATVRRRLLSAYLEAGRPADALGEAVELVRRGYVFSPAAQAMLLTLDPTAAQREVLALQEPNSVPLEGSKLLATVPAEVHLVESVWRDPRSDDLFVTSVVSRALHVRRGQDAWAAVPIEGAGSLSGMGFAPATGLLWVGSGVFDQTPEPGTAFRGLIALDPATGEEKRRVAAPEGGSPSDLAVDTEGTVYASDPLSGAVYRARSGALQLETLVEPGMFRSPQGIVALPDGSRIVVSDYAYGLALVEVDTGSIHRIAGDMPMLLDGIDGLWLDGDRLVGVQNGARPIRVVELTLSADKTRVTAATVREKAHPAWTEPVGGSVSDGELIYVATGQWDRFGDGGALTGDRPPAPTEIRALPLLP
jgi:hypothetical protein